MAWFERALGEWVVKNRWLIIFATLMLVAAAGSGARFLTINNDTRVFFSKENPQLQALEALENTYNKSDNVLFVVEPEDGNVFTPKTLQAVIELTDHSWQLPYSSRVDSITNFQHTEVEEDDLIVEDLVGDTDNITEDGLERVKKIALTEPQLVHNLVSSSGHVTGVNITILAPGKSMNEIREVAVSARNIADGIREKYPDINLYIAGGVMFDNAFGEASENDMVSLIPLMFATLVLITGLLLRSVFGTVSTLAVIMFSMITGMGLAGWMGISLNPASVNAPTLILTLAVADSVHILVTMFQYMNQGNSKHDAIAESVRLNLVPVFLTSITTAIGFLTMNFSDVPPFRDLGNIVAAGVMSAFIYSVFFLPAIVAVLPLKKKPMGNYRGCACGRVADLVINKRRQLFSGTLIIIFILAAGLLLIEFNDDFVTYFDERYDVRIASDFAEENMSGLDRIEYSLESGETGGINNPDYLMTVAKFTEWYRDQPKVVHVSTISDTMKRLNRDMHGSDEAYYRIPEQRDLAAQYLLLYEMSLPFGLDLNNQINVDKSATRMVITLRDMTAIEIRELDEMAREWLSDNAPEHMYTYGSGISMMWAHITGRNIKSMINACFWALVLISGILTFAFRSMRIGLLSLVPNLAPAFMAFGFWGIIKGEVGLGLSVVVTMTIGIVVDDTVHFLSKYLRARREQGMDSPGAIQYAFDNVGSAMWITTAALVAGFMVLTLSGYKMNFDMGLMSAITITLALALDFLFLPVLLMKVDGNDRGDG
jgi:predicted RND superfamily exporter protein